MPHATSFGLDWPYTPKRREKKPATSNGRRSHHVTGDGADEHPGAEVLIYRAMFTSPQYGDRHVWVRPADNFFQEVEIGGRRVPRFRYLGDSADWAETG